MTNYRTSVLIAWWPWHQAIIPVQRNRHCDNLTDATGSSHLVAHNARLWRGPPLNSLKPTSRVASTSSSLPLTWVTAAGVTVPIIVTVAVDRTGTGVTGVRDTASTLHIHLLCLVHIQGQSTAWRLTHSHTLRIKKSSRSISRGKTFTFLDQRS